VVLLFAFAVSAVCGALFGLLPVVKRAMAEHPVEALRAD
jgi:hypothetical protein